MSNHTVGDNAFLHNGVAKDDIVAPAGNTLKASVLLANDPGSAKFVGFYDPIHSPNAAVSSLAGVSYDSHTGMIAFNDPTVTSFDYVIQVGNGAYSVAHVTLTPHLGDELVQNWDFMQPAVPAGGYAALSTLPSWTVAGNQAEVISNSYLDAPGAPLQGADPANQSLDTQASPGGVTVSQQIADYAGGHVQLKLSIAAEEVVHNGSTFTTTPGSVLTVSWDGQVVGTISESDFLKNGAVDYNSFKTFTFDVTATGHDTITISDSGQGYAGYALDWVSAKEWIV